MTGAAIVPAGPDHRVAFRPSTFADVLRSEWTKLRSVRSTFWALAVTVVVGIALGAAISAVAAHGYAKSSVSGRLSWDPTAVSLDGMGIATLAIAVLGVLCVSSEYSSGMIRTSLIAVPRRGRVLAAKSLVFAVVTFVVGEATSFTAFFVGQALISGHAPHAALGDPGVARAVAGAGLALTALAVLSVAAGTLLRRPAAAIACMIAVLFVAIACMIAVLFVAIVYAIAWTRGSPAHRQPDSRARRGTGPDRGDLMDVARKTALPSCRRGRGPGLDSL